jgi:hypothetical protein
VERRRRVFKFHPPVGQGVKMKPSISRVKKKVIVKTKKNKKSKNDGRNFTKKKRKKKKPLKNLLFASKNRNERNRIIQHSTRPVNNNWSETVLCLCE